MFNVDRTIVDSPTSLKKRTKYDGQDVYVALKTIFFNKCYLCETKNPLSVNIEHLHAHQGDLVKKFDWNNLYYVCGRCNNVKLVKYNEILDSCDKKTDVFKAIKLSVPTSPKAKSINIQAMDDDPKTIMTKKLLDEIFNSNNTLNKQITGAYLRTSVFKRYNILLTQLNKFYDDDSSEEEIEESLLKIKVMIKRDKPYSAFIRWCILEDEELGPLFEPLMD